MQARIYTTGPSSIEGVSYYRVCIKLPSSGGLQWVRIATIVLGSMS